MSEAVGYLEEAADQYGNIPALRRLAEMYEKGEEGVAAKDTRKALHYYR